MVSSAKPHDIDEGLNSFPFIVKFLAQLHVVAKALQSKSNINTTYTTSLPLSFCALWQFFLLIMLQVLKILYCVKARVCPETLYR